MGQKTKQITERKKKEFKQQMKAKYKEKKKALQEKRARLIIKNLPFLTTEEKLKEHFSKYGEIKDLNILKKSDGKLVGCGFIQFAGVQQAAKAKHYTNGKPFLGRDIQCDFVLAKNQFIKKQRIQNSKKEAVDESKIKTEDEIKKEDEEIKEGKKEEDEDNSSSEDEKEEGTKNEAESEDSSDESDSEDQKESEVDKTEIKPLYDKKPRVLSNDVSEGKTVFIKNIPFEAKDEDLKECMSQFGPLFYAKICIDRLTEHSKGTGFVKFRTIEDTEKCLQAGTELQLMGNILDCHKALNKAEIQKKAAKDNTQSDNRNLYLMKEGLILAGSPAAEGVSSSDMAKRLQIEQYKSQMLKKLNMFVSKTRLIVHNLPPNIDNTKLKQIFLKYAGPKAVVKEARVMRNMFNVNEKGVGASKEYGFVSFTTHEHALNALRSLNNNPNIWTPKRRPIVGFSIENRDMIKARENRLLVSKRKNPLSKDYNPNIEKEKKGKNIKVMEEKEFSGVAAKPGVNKMRSKHNLNTEAKLHHQNVRTNRFKKKLERKQKSEKFVIRQPKQSQQKVQKPVAEKKLKGEDNFVKMVNSYKKKLMEASEKRENKKAKWYE